MKDEDVVKLEVAGRSLELPILRVPGLADGTLVLSLGYGRKQAGRVGNGVGFDAYALRTSAASRPRDRREADCPPAGATRWRRPRSTARWRVAR